MRRAGEAPANGEVSNSKVEGGREPREVVNGSSINNRDCGRCVCTSRVLLSNTIEVGP